MFRKRVAHAQTTTHLDEIDPTPLGLVRVGYLAIGDRQQSQRSLLEVVLQFWLDTLDEHAHMLVDWLHGAQLAAAVAHSMLASRRNEAKLQP